MPIQRGAMPVLILIKIEVTVRGKRHVPSMAVEGRSVREEEDIITNTSGITTVTRAQREVLAAEVGQFLPRVADMRRLQRDTSAG